MQVEPNYERVTRKEIKDAVKACATGFKLLDPFYKHHFNKSSVDIFYFEISCQEDKVKRPVDLSLFEKTLLQKIEARIQVVVPPLYMQRNDEEIIKNLLALRREVCFIRDIPQVMILYDHHTIQEMTFTIVLVRVKKKGDPSVLDLLDLNSEEETYTQGQTCSFENLSEEHTIEGNIFQIELKNIARFKKKNGSIDYKLSRKHVVQCLQNSLGDIRDYNGGLFLLRDEKFEKLKKAFPKAPHSYLESFFYSIKPAEKQIALPTNVLFSFFKLFQRLFIENQLQLLTETCDVTLFIACKHESKEFFKEEEPLLKSKIPYETVISSQWFHGNFLFKGLILSFDTLDHLQQYEKELREKMTQISSPKLPQKKILYINGEFNRFDFDPRMSGTNQSIMINNLLFEGLIRINKKDEVSLAYAASYQRSSDEKTYTFQLKELCWSNGAPLIADDFESTWKKILSPDSDTFFHHLLYSILNARKAKEGKVSLDAVGVKALNKTKLEIQLRHPVSHFLKLLAHPIFSPTYSELDKTNPQWGYEKNVGLVCNGPFRPKLARPFYISELEKNPYFRNQEQIALDGISISNIHSHKAFKTFRTEEVDCPRHPFEVSKQNFVEHSDNISYSPVSKVFWYCFNVKSFPFSNKKIRQAFFHAVDRQKIVEGIKSKTEPAYSPLPKELTSFFPKRYVDIENKEKAKQYFAAGLKELGISRKAFPSITITLFNTELSYQVGYNFKKQIEEALGVQCSLLKFDFQEVLYKMKLGDYEISAFRWSAWVNDPMYALTLFSKENNLANLFHWENSQYRSFLEKAWTTKDQQKKSKLLSQAEQLLIEDYVILSLFYGQDTILNNSDLEIDQLNQLNLLA